MGSITQNIRDIMSLKGISQKELAQRLGMSPSQLSAIFNADPEHNFTIKTLRRFAAALDVDLDVRLSDRNAVRHDTPTIRERSPRSSRDTVPWPAGTSVTGGVMPTHSSDHDSPVDHWRMTGE